MCTPPNVIMAGFKANHLKSVTGVWRLCLGASAEIEKSSDEIFVFSKIIIKPVL